MINKRVFIGVVLALAAVGAGSYFMIKKLQKDREAALSFIPPSQPRPIAMPPSQKRETVTYTQKDLEEMRKKGTVPPGVAQPPAQMPQNTGEAAVQRSLRTIDEVNRINEMNRRIQEQQERIRNQR
jgi:hypothetical protein